MLDRLASLLEGVACDHAGKASQARLCIIMGTLAAAAYALLPLFGFGEQAHTDYLVVSALVGFPGGYAAWQKKNVEGRDRYA